MHIDVIFLALYERQARFHGGDVFNRLNLLAQMMASAQQWVIKNTQCGRRWWVCAKGLNLLIPSRDTFRSIWSLHRLKSFIFHCFATCLRIAHIFRNTQNAWSIMLSLPTCSQSRLSWTHHKVESVLGKDAELTETAALGTKLTTCSAVIISFADATSSTTASANKEHVTHWGEFMLLESADNKDLIAFP